VSHEAPAAFWENLPLGRDVTLLQRDANGLAAFAKPAGVLSHPNEARDAARSLLTCAYRSDGEYYEWSADGARPAGRLYLLNRLDSATSGVLLACASEQLAKDIRALFQRRHIRKVYCALVFGVPTATHQVWKDQLAVQKKGGQIRTEAVGNIPAEAHMHVLRTRRAATPLALISLEPKTGRSHQLRVQCAKRHLPIVGDATYGNFHANREFAKVTGEKRLFLHSLETTFDYESKGRTYHFKARAELPKQFEAIW
jgi:tRNA pseudouridine65 synthase